MDIVWDINEIDKVFYLIDKTEVSITYFNAVIKDLSIECISENPYLEYSIIMTINKIVMDKYVVLVKSKKGELQFDINPEDADMFITKIKNKVNFKNIVDNIFDLKSDKLINT